jgi:transposase
MNSMARNAASTSKRCSYSPDLNPIEQVFAKLKTLLRKAAARTVDAVSAAIGQLLDRFTQQECANCFKNAGYTST